MWDSTVYNFKLNIIIFATYTVNSCLTDTLQLQVVVKVPLKNDYSSKLLPLISLIRISKHSTKGVHHKLNPFTPKI